MKTFITQPRKPQLKNSSSSVLLSKKLENIIEDCNTLKDSAKKSWTSLRNQSVSIYDKYNDALKSGHSNKLSFKSFGEFQKGKKKILKNLAKNRNEVSEKYFDYKNEKFRYEKMNLDYKKILKNCRRRFGDNCILMPNNQSQKTLSRKPLKLQKPENPLKKPIPLSKSGKLPPLRSYNTSDNYKLDYLTEECRQILKDTDLHLHIENLLLSINLKNQRAKLENNY